jgi:hypothetical protein
MLGTAVKGELLHHNQQFHYTLDSGLLSIEKTLVHEWARFWLSLYNPAKRVRV